MPAFKSCGGCRYFVSQDNPTTGIGKGVPTIMGECRFNPPQVFPIMGQTKLGQPAMSLQSFHPAVNEAHFCGRWEPALSIQLPPAKIGGEAVALHDEQRKTIAEVTGTDRLPAA